MSCSYLFPVSLELGQKVNQEREPEIRHDRTATYRHVWRQRLQQTEDTEICIILENKLKHSQSNKACVLWFLSLLLPHFLSYSCTHTQKNLYILTLNFMVTDLNEFLLLISKGACSDTQMMEGKRRGEEMKRSNGPCFRHSSFSFHLNLCFTLCLSTSPDRQVLYNPIGITPSLWVYQGQFTLALSL